MARVVQRDALTNFSEVLNIEGAFGGNQYWYFSERKNRYLKDRSCGLIACANLLLYLIKTRKAYQNVFPDTLTISNYLDFCEQLRRYLNPTMLGIFSFSHMNYAIKKFSEAHGMAIVPIYHRVPFTLDHCSRYIQSAIQADLPVLMLNYNAYCKDLVYHWVTITAIEKQEDGEIFFECSNWGKRKKYSLTKWFQYHALYKGLMCYQQEELWITKKSMKIG